MLHTNPNGSAAPDEVSGGDAAAAAHAKSGRWMHQLSESLAGARASLGLTQGAGSSATLGSDREALGVGPAAPDAATATATGDAHPPTPRKTGSFSDLHDAENPDTLVDQVLRDARESPLSREEFIAFLKREHCDELARFWMDSDAHAMLASRKEEKAKDLAARILADFIQVGGKDEINLPDKMRKEIAERVRSSDESKLDPKLFNPAKREVRGMLVGGPFNRFLRQQLETNITDKEAMRRYGAGVALGLLSLGIVGLFMLLQAYTAQPVLQERWWRLVCYPFLLWSIALLFSAKQRVCQGLAAQCVRMKPGDSWFDAYARADGITRVADKFALRAIQDKARWMTKWSVVLSIAIMAALVALPPGYGLAAP